LSEQPGHPALVEAIFEGRAPERVRAAAARGALPLPRAVLAHLFVHLSGDESEEIRTAASSSLEQLDAENILQILGDPTCAAPVLQHFAPKATRDQAMAEKIAFHPETPSKALGQLAAKGSAQVVELVLTNEERLLAVPGLLETLMGNPVLRVDQRGRILEFLERADQARQKRREAAQAGAAGKPGESTTGDKELSVEDVAELLEVDVGELLSQSEIVDGDEFEAAENLDIRDAYRRILTLNTAQKAILAMKGGREERQILIRDSNKVVALGVLKNPRMTDSEIEGIANMRNVSEEILRHVGRTREWTKHYAVVHALILNPRTPPAVTTNFVSRLNARDLKRLLANRDVPELIRRMARRTHDMRTQKSTAFKR
jgi:hypothetical protein